MAYGVLYEFRRTSTNGADILITISQRDYEGEVKQRSLGRAPVLKRENNGHIYGTSCELYAECLVDGEFSQLYTSDAYEFRVAVYRNDSLLWMGFVSPELYSEPDVAPPYDVQIIATDGLGELKNFKFEKRGVASMLSHINYLMGKTGIGMALNIVSELRYVDDAGVASADKGVLDFKINLDHEEGSTCYDVLQNLMSSINANITQYNGRYLIFRETDFINKATEEGVEGFDINGSAVSLPVASFGSMNQHKWWPVGQLSTVIEPAKNEVVLRAPDHYKDNVLDFDDWALANAASFNEEEGAYILPDEGSNISQYVDFDGVEVGYRLGLRVRARNVGSSEDEQNIGIKVEIEGRSYSAGDRYWLVKSSGTSSGRQLTDYMWRNVDDYIEEELPLPSDADTDSDAQDIDIVLPLYRNGSRSYVYAKNVKLTIFNPAGIHDIYVYGVSLVKYEQIEGYEADVVINNAAREEEGEVELTMSAGDLAPAAGKVFMTGIPLFPSGSDPIKQWQVGNGNPQDYLSVMAYDYSRAIAMPKMKYAGVLNVPGETVSVPLLFLRDGTYYFPKTYSYDIYNDELEVELISISAADVSLTSVIISQMAQSSGNMGGLTTSGSGGGGVVSLPRDKEMSDTSDNAVENRVIKAYVDGEVKEVADRLASMWYFDSDGNLCTDHDVIIKANLIVEKDTSSGGEGEDTPSGGGGIDESQLAEYLESNNYVNSSAKITSLLGYTPANGANYLPLAGGTINGGVYCPLRIAGTSTRASIGFSKDASAFAYLTYNGGSSWAVTNEYYNNEYTLIHSGNIGSQKVAGLATPCTIWGQSFDGTNNVAGSLHSNLGYYGLSIVSEGGSPESWYGVKTFMTWNEGSTMGACRIGTSYKYQGLTIGFSTGHPYDHTIPDGYTYWEAVCIQGNGNVGIGTTSPAAKLHVSYNSGTAGIEISRTSNGTEASIAFNQDAYPMRSVIGGWDRNLNFYHNGATRMTISDTGAVTMSSTLTVGSHILAASANTSYIGGFTTFFRTAYINTISSGDKANNMWLVGGNYTTTTGIQFARSSDGSATGKIGSWDATGLYPATNNAYTLGTNSNMWKVVYTPLLQSAGGLDIVANGGGTASRLWLTTNCFRPWSADAGLIDLGLSSIRWRNVYAVNGIFSGDTSSGSDVRFKDIIKDKTLKIENIAKAPLFTFKWNDRDDDTVHLGSSAQYWEKVCPWLVTGEDFKSLNYATLGVAMGISLAKKAVNHEARLKALERENKELKETIRRMEYGDR